VRLGASFSGVVLRGNDPGGGASKGGVTPSKERPGRQCRRASSHSCRSQQQSGRAGKQVGGRVGSPPAALNGDKAQQHAQRLGERGRGQAGVVEGAGAPRGTRRRRTLKKPSNEKNYRKVRKTKADPNAPKRECRP